jgi:hypothetical protein
MTFQVRGRDGQAIHAGGTLRRANGTQLMLAPEVVRFVPGGARTRLKPARPIPSRPMSRSGCPKACAASALRSFQCAGAWMSSVLLEGLATGRAAKVKRDCGQDRVQRADPEF